MTVQTTSNKAGPYAGNGVTVTWGTTFRVDQASDLQVILTDGAGVETTLSAAQYAVSGWGDTAGVTVTYPLSGAPLGPTQKITLLRLVGYDQQTSITNQGGFYPKVIEAALDRIVYQCQQLAEKLGRAVTVNVSSAQDPSAVFNSIATNAAAAANSASQAATTWTTFHNQYLGAFTSDPAIDNSGNPLQQGALYWNTTNSRMRIYGGIGWQDTAVAQAASFSSSVFSGTGAQTAFTLSAVPPSVNACIVSVSGVTQRPYIDFTVSGTTLAFTSAPPAGTNNVLALVASSLAVGAPSDGSVTTAKLVDASVTPSKLTADVGVGPLAAARNTRMSVPTANATATVTAEELLVATGVGGTIYRRASFNKTINLGASGAGGMDIGTAPVSGFVCVYAIYNPSTQTDNTLACLASTSAGSTYTGANMPAGYTASALLGMWPTNGSGQFIAGFQRERTFWHQAKVNVASGNSGLPTTLTSLSIASALPPQALTVSGILGNPGGSTTNPVVAIAGDAGGTGEVIVSTNSNTGVGISFEAFSAASNFSNLPIITPQTIYYRSLIATQAVRIDITGYTF